MLREREGKKGPRVVRSEGRPREGDVNCGREATGRERRKATGKRRRSAPLTGHLELERLTADAAALAHVGLAQPASSCRCIFLSLLFEKRARKKKFFSVASLRSPLYRCPPTTVHLRASTTKTLFVRPRQRMLFTSLPRRTIHFHF
ncbi:hypothetical protein MRX96_038079 [Rhipicephalus microplus]